MHRPSLRNTEEGRHELSSSLHFLNPIFHPQQFRLEPL